MTLAKKPPDPGNDVRERLGREHLVVIEGGRRNLAGNRPVPADAFGRLLSLRATDGAHRLGSAHAVRVLPRGGRGAADAGSMDALLRLTEHYGRWLGFGGSVGSVGMGRARFLGTVPEGAGRIEFRIHVRCIGRRRERLVVDGEAFCDGVPILRVERIEIGPPGTAARSAARA